MKKIMLALSLLSVGGMISAAERGAEKIEVNVTFPDGSNQVVSLSNNQPAHLIMHELNKLQLELTSTIEFINELVVDGTIYSSRLNNLFEIVPLKTDSNLVMRTLDLEKQINRKRRVMRKEHQEEKEQHEQQLQQLQQEQQKKQLEREKREKQKRQKQRLQQATASLTVSTLIAAATAYVTRRAYQIHKKRLVEKYDLGNLKKFEDTLWLATIIARYGVPWRLRTLISKNPAAVAKLSDPFLNALAELYYRKTPSQVQTSQFMQRFFPGRK